MKNRLIGITMTLAVCLALISCMEKVEKFAPKVPADGDITLTIPVAALPAPPAGQAQVTQPDLNVISGRFAITDDLTITIGVTSGLTNVTVATVGTNSDGTRAVETKGTFSGVNGSVDFSNPVNTLAIGGKAPSTGSSVTLLVTASNADNTKTASKAFVVTVLDPFTITTPPATAYPDSTITLPYTVPASTTLVGVNQVDVYAKRGKKGVESLFSTKTYTSSLSLATSVKYKMGPENPGQGTDATKLDTVFFRYVATFAPGRTVTKTGSTRFVNVPLSKTTTALALYNPAVTGTNASKVAYDFSKLAYNKTTDGDALKDLKLSVVASAIGITAGVGNATTFVKSTNTVYTSTTLSFQQVRDLFAAGTAAPAVPNIYVNDVYIAQIDGGAGSAAYVIFKVTTVNLTPDTDNTDNIVFDYKSK